MADENIYSQNPTLDEIVFENRNKEYGAYDIRHQYPRLLTKSFIIGTSLFLIAALSPFIYLTIKNMNAEEKKVVELELKDVLQEDPILEQPIEEEPPPPPPPPKEEEKIEIIQNVVPEPVKAPKIETPPPPISKQLETATGIENQAGVKAPTNYAPPPSPPSTGTKASTAEVKPQVTNDVYESVDQSADFTGGGLSGFRKKFENSFDPSSVEGEGSLKTQITFVVERDGTLSQVKATGSNADFNREAERAVKSIKIKWSPGKVNGEPVRSRFRFPVSMNFE